MPGAVKFELHFHDLRHEAINRFFERGLSLPEVALISGHRDHRMLLRYTHLRPGIPGRQARCEPLTQAVARLFGCLDVGQDPYHIPIAL